jgi:release factor glutamine methyltransferase
MLDTELKLYLTQELLPLYDAEESTALAGELIESFQQELKSANREQWMLAIQQALVRLKEAEPLQYVLGEAWFYNLPFYVNSHVLIPRPETEELVHTIIQEYATINLPSNTQLSILDIGTGSGCIPIALKKNLDQTTVYGMDISADALSIANQNAKRNGVEITFLRGDILNMKASQIVDLQYDIIVSNPPYITEAEKEHMHTNVLSYEPHLALFVTNNDPLQFYKAIADYASTHLVHQGRLYVEINAGYALDVKYCFEQYGFTDVIIATDMQGKERFVSCKWE